MASFILLAALVATAQAFTPPTTATWGPLLTPDLSNSVTQGETFTVTWDPSTHSTDGVTVSLVLCHGPSNNCQTASNAIVEGVPASAKSYSWDVPCDLAAGTASTETGYGMLIIVDGTGEFQYSTQFSVNENPSCSSTASTTTSSSSPSSDTTSTPYTHGGQGGYSNGTTYSTTAESNSSSIATSTVLATISAPSSIVYATSSASTLSTAAVAGTTSYAVATPSAQQTGSTFTGAAARATGFIGLVAAGGLAMLAL